MERRAERALALARTRRLTLAESLALEAKPMSRATAARSYPGFFASSAAARSRTRSIARLSVGAAPAEKLRLRCSRVTPSARAISAVPIWRLRARSIARHAATLQRRAQRERLGRRVERGGEARRKSVRQQGVAEHAVVGAIGEYVREVELGASRDGGRVDGAKGRERDERDARILARELGRAVSVAVGGDFHERGVHEVRVERVGEVALRAREDAAAMHAHEARADARARVLARRVGDDDGVSRRARGHQCARGAPPTVSAARCSTSRAFAYEMSASASSIGTHLHAVIPSSRCGLVLAFSDSIRKKWQILWISFPRKRKCQSMVESSPRSTRSLSPVSSDTSRSAAASATSLLLEMPLGKSPVAVAVANEEKERASLLDAVYHASGGDFAGGARACHDLSARGGGDAGHLDFVQRRAPFNELANDRILRVPDLLDGADLAHSAIVEHRDARADASTRCACRA